MKLQIFSIKKFQRQTHIWLAVINFYSALKKDGNYYPQEFLKECKYIKKKVIMHIINDLQSYSDDSNDSDEK